MSRNSLFSVGIALVLCAVVVTVPGSSVARCFQFSWLGPRWTNESVFMNATCLDATRLSGTVPCKEPLVVSYDGSWPDVNYIWQNYPDASCILADNDVCAQYTYYFDGKVENSTYFCTRAVDDSGVAITSGCVEQVNGSSTTRVCLCRSAPGGIPCNNTTMPSLNYPAFILVALVVLIPTLCC